MNNPSIKFLLLWLAVGFGMNAFAEEDPLQFVKSTADQVLAEVLDRKEELEADPRKIYALVEQVVLPRFDFLRMSRLVLGKYWRRANTQQREAFTREFRELLIRTYATALLNYSGQEIVYLPLRAGKNPKDVTVNTQVREAGAPPVPVDYRLHLSGAGWKVYDVSIDTISLVSNYRSSFASQIRRYKLDGLITKLNSLNEKGR
ncbi:MAG: ABC transporter substrate-binding protein [Gammaproteobacteria bacterium]|nr:ABC transporter substrate-binding protein [Gammaproteobacteria bacterium]